jgi:ankyrin repeat protein
LNWKDISKIKEVEYLCEVIASSSLDVNERDDRGRTPLMIFLTNRTPLEGIRCLLKAGPDLEAEDKLGDTALKKAVRFKQPQAISLLLEHGAKLDSPKGIMATAWNLAREHNPNIADMLLDTPGAIRLKLTDKEQQIVDDIIYEESSGAACEKVRMLDSEVLVHAVVTGFNWDDSPEPMVAAAEHPKCAEITRLDMIELMEAEYWLEMDLEEVNSRVDGPKYRHLAAYLTRKD